MKFVSIESLILNTKVCFFVRVKTLYRNSAPSIINSARGTIKSSFE